MTEDQMPPPAAHWLPFVQAFVLAYKQGEGLSAERRPHPADQRIEAVASHPSPNGQKTPLILLCSPHPDDETLTGALPLRLLREQGARVVNLAVTLGSNQARQGERWSELLEACAVLGFDCQRLPMPADFDLKAGKGAKGWQAALQILGEYLASLRPDFVSHPHALDRHPAHAATSQLVAEALARWTESGHFTTLALETEYWQPMSAPNLLIGLSSADEACLLAALACHRGEIARNPYHLTHPARLLDNVRRGAELVRSSLAARPDFLFGELYRLSVWREGRNQPLDLAEGWLGPGQELSILLSMRQAL